MSMMDSGLANPLSPLHQSLLRSMPNTLNVPPQQGMVGADDQAGTLMRAHNLRAGNPGAGQMTPGSSRGTPGGGSPVGTSLSKYKTLMMTAAGLSDDEKTVFKDAANDPAISPAALKDLLTMRQKAKPNGHHNFDGAGAGPGQVSLPNNGASIGGAAPASLQQGSIQITRGRGPNGMSEDAMQQWAARAQQAANGSGEQFMRVQNDQVPRTSFFQKPTGFGAQPGSQFAGRGDITRGPLQGFQVNGIQAPQQPAPHGGQQADPVVGMYQALQQAGADAQGLAQWKAFAQAGATPEQLHMAAQHLMGQQQSAQNHQASQQEKAQHQASQQEQHRSDLMIRQLQHQQTLASQMGDNDTVNTLQQKIDGMLKPAAPSAPQQQQLPSAPKPGHPLDAQTAQHFMQAAGGDKNKARALAQQAGWSF